MLLNRSSDWIIVVVYCVLVGIVTGIWLALLHTVILWVLGLFEIVPPGWIGWVLTLIVNSILGGGVGVSVKER